ncbi:MAG: gliding motility-associated C-terminal domain-containing protein [Flavobacteriaceae bacterium]
MQDPLGCTSVNSASRLIRVMPEPDFSGTPDSYNISCGDSVTLTGVVSSQTETQEIPMLTPATVALPDGTGVSFSSALDFTGLFANGATMTPGCYPTVSFDLEHSAAQDLEIKLIAPSGEEVVLYNRGGDPVEFTGFGTCANENDDAVPGCTAPYTVVGNNSGVNWDAPASQTTVTATCPDFAGPCENPGFFGYYYVPTTYNSDSSFASLDGASLNGMWTLEITDHEINDDGVLKTWSLDFPQSCYSLESVTPNLTTATWTGGGPALPAQNTTSTGITDPGPDACPTPGTCTGNELTNSPTVGPFMTPGTSTYTITVVDEFGCEYHKDVTVTASCSCILTLDTANNNQTVCENTAITDIQYTVGGDATSATISGLPPGVTGTYVGGVFTISGTPTSSIGSPYNYTVSTVGCTPEMTATGTITVNALPDIPTINTTAPTCAADGSSTITNYDPSATYTFTPAGPTVGAGGVISGMTIGTSYTVNASNAGCTSNDSVAFTNLAMLVTPAVPTVTTTAATCAADGSSTISNYDPSVTYTFTPAGPTVGAGGVISGMTAGTSYTVNANNGSCTSNESAAFTNDPMLTTPAVPTISTTAATCSADGSSTISNYDPSATYTFTPAGPTVGAGGVISGMTVGTSYTVNANNGSCSSADSTAFTNDPMLANQPTPTINTTAATCAADGTSTITNYDPSATYTFTPTGPTVGAGGVISGMTVGTSYTVNASNGGCTSTESAAFTNNPMLANQPTPTINTTAATCAADGTSTITNYDPSATYTFTPTGPTVGAGGVISGMTVGTSYTVNANNGSCTSNESAAFTNDPMLTTPAVPTISTTAATCSADGSSTISNYDPSVTYTFTPAGPTVGAGGTISGMTVGTSYTVNANNGSCTSNESAAFTNDPMLTTPAVPTISTTAATCSADGSSTISNYDASVTYTFTPAGPTVSAGGVISGMTTGTSYTVNANNGSCSSADSTAFTNDQMLGISGTPVANVSVQPSCTITTGTITATSPTLGTNEEFVLEGPDATGTIQTNSTDGIFTNLSPGDYTLHVSNTSTGCISSSIQLTINEVPSIPSFNLTDGCDGVDYTISVVDPNSSYTYNWYDSSGTLIGTGISIVVTQADTYEVQATQSSCITSEYITITNAFCSIPKGISPNGDGLNDTWELSNLDVKQVKIYNRYGTEVYSKENYTNEWDGTSDKGNELPDATYYYVIWFNNDKTTTGWVYINR